MPVNYTDDPTISDVVRFDFRTTDALGNYLDPYTVDKVTIYFLERGFIAEQVKLIDINIADQVYSEFYQQAIPVAVLGDDNVSAWSSVDDSDAFISKIDFDVDGNPLLGYFRLDWTPDYREGDYFLCYQWTPLLAGTSLNNAITFYLAGDTSATTSIPTHITNPEKYDTLMDRYSPEVLKLSLFSGDLTPEVIGVLNGAVAKSFTLLENLTNQIVDLLDANAASVAILPYLAGIFALRLKSLDITLWRRQIKEAVPLYKKKGTSSGLHDALAAAGMTLLDFQQYWQVTSPYTFTESFKITTNGDNSFTLVNVPFLPADPNYEIAVRLHDTPDYDVFPNGFVSFSGKTLNWLGTALEVNDILRIKYKIKAVADQSLEDYIKSLPLADVRDEANFTFPRKNWNVKLLGRDDALFDILCPTRHPFQYPVVWGKIRTEFPYSENIFNMDEYNGSVRDSTDPCDQDKSFLDTCSCCLSSKVGLDIEVTDLSADRISEAEEVLQDFLPFHTQVQSVNYSGAFLDFIPSPEEEIEILGNIKQTDNILAMQGDFNRLVTDGSSSAHALKRNMLASANVIYSGSGLGKNQAVVLFSENVRFDTLGIGTTNYLEILSGANQGEYSIGTTQAYTADIIQAPSAIPFPLNTASFPFRLSNLLYSQSSAAVYQDNEYYFSASINFIDYGIMNTWKIKITAGIYSGTYSLLDVYPNNTLRLVSFPATGNVSNLNFELRNELNQVVYAGLGNVAVIKVARVEINLVYEELGIIQTDYVKVSGAQYKIRQIIRSGSVDKVYIDGYTGGDVVPVSVNIYRRLLDNVVGYVDLRGMTLTGTVPVLDYTLDDDQFRENYLILIGGNYYQITNISGGVMTLVGAAQSWGVIGTSVNYSILQFVKTSPIVAEDGQTFRILDRRGNDAITIETENVSLAGMAFFLSGNNLGETVSQQENIWYTVENK